MPTIQNLTRTFKVKEFKGLVVDTYITGKEAVKRHVSDVTYTVGYKKVRSDGTTTTKFATLMVIRGESILILHLGRNEDKHGIAVQHEIDALLGKEYIRSEVQEAETANETFIRLDWVDDLTTILPYIDQAYEKRDRW